MCFWPFVRAIFEDIILVYKVSFGYLGYVYRFYSQTDISTKTWYGLLKDIIDKELQKVSLREFIKHKLHGLYGVSILWCLYIHKITSKINFLCAEKIRVETTLHNWDEIKYFFMCVLISLVGFYGWIWREFFNQNAPTRLIRLHNDRRLKFVSIMEVVYDSVCIWSLCNSQFMEFVSSDFLVSLVHTAFLVEFVPFLEFLDF